MLITIIRSEYHNVFVAPVFLLLVSLHVAFVLLAEFTFYISLLWVNSFMPRTCIFDKFKKSLHSQGHRLNAARHIL